MRDTLALALVRAELCRAHAAERHRFDETRSSAGLRAAIGRTLRFIRTMIRGRVVERAPSRHARRADSESSSPD